MNSLRVNINAVAERIEMPDPERFADAEIRRLEEEIVSLFVSHGYTLRHLQLEQI